MMRRKNKYPFRWFISTDSRVFCFGVFMVYFVSRKIQNDCQGIHQKRHRYLYENRIKIWQWRTRDILLVFTGYWYNSISVGRQKTLDVVKWFLKGFNDDFLTKIQKQAYAGFEMIEKEYVKDLSEYIEILKTGIVK